MQLERITYTNPASIITISVMFPALGAIAVFLRFFARNFLNSGIQMDDWLTLPVAVCKCPQHRS